MFGASGADGFVVRRAESSDLARANGSMVVQDLRSYQARWLIRRTRRTLYALCAFAIVAIYLVVWSEGHYSPWVSACGLAATNALIVLWMEKVTVRTGLEEVEDGYVYRHSFGSHHFRFDEVVHFEAGRMAFWRGTPAVHLVLRDGRMRIEGLVQGRPTSWDDGETDDIVGVLNERHHNRVAAAPKAGQAGRSVGSQ